MAAQQHGLRHGGELVAADAEGRPDRTLGQLGLLVGHGLGVIGRTPRDSEAELEHRRAVDQAFGDELLAEPQVSAVEDFHLWLHAIGADELRLFAQLRGGLDDDGIAIAEVQRAAIERADLGAEFLHVDEALLGADAIRAGAEIEGLGARAHFNVAAHAGGEVDYDLLVLRPDALHHLGVVLDLARALAGRRLTDVAVDHGGAGAGGLEGRIGDLLRGDRNGRVLADGVTGSGDCAGDDDFGLHEILLTMAVEARADRKSTFDFLRHSLS